MQRASHGSQGEAADYRMGTNRWGRGGVYDGGITGITNEILVVESC